jgi:NAD(P)-dependent dehydrogenase (short-subunit alcohol dehydrogenase family)
MFDVTKKVTVITGSRKEGSIGFAIAKGFYDAGAITIRIVRNEDITKISDNEWVTIGDITDTEIMRKCVDSIIKQFGKIDVLINCAGITRGPVSSERYPYKYFEETLNTNLVAPFKLSQFVAENMIRYRTGSIINIASIGAFVSTPGNPAYGISKSGMVGMTRFLARDWGQYNVRVNAICPGYILTDMTRKGYDDPIERQKRIDRMVLQRYGKPEEIVGPAIFLASEASSYITGQTIVVDGGWLSKGF